MLRGKIAIVTGSTSGIGLGIARCSRGKAPSRTFVTPEQLGGTVAFLCSPAADQITGTAIAVGGAWTTQ